jgi:hypothetical protein
MQLGGSARPNSAPDSPSSSLPHPTGDDGYAAVLARFHASAPRQACDTCHIHSELRIINVNGRETTAIVDQWRSGNLYRLEERAENWSVASFSDGDRVWSVQQGIPPIRLWATDGFPDLFPRPNPAERRIRIYAPQPLKLLPRETDGVKFSCSGRYAGAEICFDAESGFPVEATVDQEQVVFKSWAKFGEGFYPSRLALYRGRRLQMEASTAITPLAASERALFRPPAGASERSALDGMYSVESHRLAASDHANTASFCDALVKVFVDDTGRVRRAELLDADDKDLGAAALSAARRAVYVPDRKSGESQAFETGFFVSQWSTADPLRVEATSQASQGTD